MTFKQSAISFISGRLSTLILLPCVLLAMIVSFDIYRATEAMNDAYDSEYNAFMAHGILDVVHEVQKERGLTAGFIGSQGERFSSELRAQRRTVEQKLNYLKKESNSWQLPSESVVTLNQFNAAFNQLNATRNKVDSLNITLAQALGFYTNINTLGLNAVITASKISKNQKISAELFAIYNFSSTKESAGIERAVLSNVFARDNMTASLRNSHVALVTKQDVYMSEALDAAPDEMFQISEQVNNES